MFQIFNSCTILPSQMSSLELQNLIEENHRLLHDFASPLTIAMMAVELSICSYQAAEISLLGTNLEKARAALEKMSSRLKEHRLKLKLADHQFEIEN